MRVRGGFLGEELDEDDAADEVDDAGAASARPSGSAPPPSGEVPPSRALSRQEIVDKLNEVPVFCITNLDGNVIGMRAADGAGKPMVCWFTDAMEARALLDAAQKSSEASLRLGCHGMGAVFTQCNGWGAADAEPTEAGAAPTAQSEAGEAVELKLQGSHKLIADTSPQLRELLASQSLDAGCWQLPIFMCKELQSTQIVPVFLHPADLSATWIKSGGTEENLPKNLAMMDIRMLVKEMQVDSSPWELIHFVVSPESIKLADELRKAKEAEAVAS